MRQSIAVAAIPLRRQAPKILAASSWTSKSTAGMAKARKRWDIRASAPSEGKPDSGVEGPVVIEPTLAARLDMMTTPKGDVLWASAWEPLDRLRIVRVEACHDG